MPARLHYTTPLVTTTEELIFPDEGMYLLRLLLLFLAAEDAAPLPSHAQPTNSAALVSAVSAAAEAGDPRAQHDLGVFYMNGTGVPQSTELALFWWNKSASQGDPIAQTKLGWCYFEGRGVPTSHSVAAEWFRAAADQGIAEAQFSLAWLYLNGDGVQTNVTEGIHLLTSAADQNHARAASDLALLYASGRFVDKNETEAFRWFRKAAAGGDREAQYNLGVVWAKGTGTKPDLVQAYRWFSIAARAGHPKARAAINEIAPDMTKDQIALATAQAGAWGLAMPAQLITPHTKPPATKWTPALTYLSLLAALFFAILAFNYLRHRPGNRRR